MKEGNQENSKFKIQNSKVKFAYFCLFTFAFCLFLGAQAVLAQQPLNLGLNQVNNAIALGGADIRTIISRIINVFLGLLGVGALGIALYGGFLWMTSQGDAEKVNRAKRVLVNGFIGMVIILSAWGITTFVLNALLRATGPGDNFGRGANGTQYGEYLSGALGSGIIENHYPARNAIDVPRDTMIIITFKEAIDPATIIEGATTNLKIANLTITQRGELALTSNEVVVQKSDDNKTFAITPVSPIGSPTENTDYLVSLKSGIRKASGDPAFPGNGYEWTFGVSTRLDLAPPQVVGIFPGRNATNVAKNALVQVNFSEALSPFSLTGAVNVREVTVSGTKTDIPGDVRFSNGYQTLEFIPKEPCGANSCGETIFCLPGGDAARQNIEVTLLSPDAQQNSNKGVVGAVGITDASRNALDGNKNGSANGQAVDSVIWTFATSDSVRDTPPELLAVTPLVGAAGVPVDARIKMEFTPFMQSLTLSNQNLKLFYTEPEFAYWVSAEFIEPATAGIDGTTNAYLEHSWPFQNDAPYEPEMSSALKDVYQNCFAPAAGPAAGSGVSRCTPTASAPYCCYDPATQTVLTQSQACAAPQ